MKQTSAIFIFLFQVGNDTVPSYLPSYPVMHTAYDSASYVMTHVDEDFTIHAALTKVAGEVVLELADASLLPVKVDDYADELQRYTVELAAKYKVDLGKFEIDAGRNAFVSF